jgi:hypothetical protein
LPAAVGTDVNFGRPFVEAARLQFLEHHAIDRDLRL